MKIGFIGGGNMASAIIGGLVSSKFSLPQNILVYDRNVDKLSKIQQKYGIQIEKSEIDIASKSDIVILAVKPNGYKAVLNTIKNSINNKTIILTIAAGYSIKNVEDIIGSDKKVIRTMPNTPAMVLEGMTAVSFNKNINDDEKKLVFNLLNSFGKSEELDESLMPVFGAICGSLPAYVDLFVEALADAGVLDGMPRQKAYNIIAQGTLGSAKMILESGEHPAKLKDDVCSPGGTTIEAIKALEKNGFRYALIDAVGKAVEKTKKMV